MSTSGDAPARRLGAGSVSHGGVRRLSVSSERAGPSEQELDHQLGFDLGYRDGLARASVEVESAAVEARLAWETEAQARQDDALRELASAQAGCVAAAEAMAVACTDEHAWAAGAAVEIAYVAVVRLLGQRHASRDLVASLCIAAAHDVAERPVRIRVAPADLESVVPHVAGATVEADDRLAPGSCELDTPRGRVVAGVNERLTLLRDAFVAGLAEHEGTPRA